MRRLLTSLGTDFLEQETVEGIAQVDFLVGKTIIQMDGTYWHNMPGRKEIDDRQDRLLSEAGYTIIRISDKEMEAEPLERVLKRKAIMVTFHNVAIASWR